MRIDQANRTIEVGAVTFSPALKQTRMGTEATICQLVMSLKSLTIAAMSGSAMPSIFHLEKQQNVWALSMKEPSAKLLSIKGRTRDYGLVVYDR